MDTKSPKTDPKPYIPLETAGTLAPEPLQQQTPQIPKS